MDTPPAIPDLTLLRRIGGGSYGDVWLARTITGVYRAVKIVDKARFADERPFLRELDGISRFQRSVGDQPRQLALMHVGRLEEQGIFYYTMELADDVEAGTDVDPEKYQPLTLKALYERRPELPAAEVVRIGVELARSLDGLHSAGLIHRDVKPSNIIFVAGVPKLADIGLVSSSDHTLTSLGTPGYSPPEGAGTTRADIYSLGKILYQLATGLHPDDFPRLPRDAATREDARALFELNEIVLKACQPDPNERHPSARAMLDELLLLQAGRSVKELNRMRERLRLLGRVAMWSGVAALLVIAVLGVKNYFTVRELAASERRARIQAEEDERFARYAADLNLAQLSLGRGDLGLARAALRRQVPGAGEPDLRGPEWHAVWNEAAGDDVQQLGTLGGAAIGSLRVSRDGNVFVGVELGESRVAVAWDRTSGQRRRLDDGVRDIGGFSPEETRVLVGRMDRSLAWIDLRDGAVTVVPEITGRIFAMSREAGVVAVGELSEGAVLVRVWSLEAAPREIGRWAGADLAPGTVASAVALDRRGEAMALALFWPDGVERSRELRVIDVSSGAMRFVRSDLGRVESLAFSDDNRSLAVGPVAEHPVLVMDAASGTTIRSFAGHAGVVRAVAFEAGGARLISAGDDLTVRVWPLSDPMAPVRVLRGHEAGVGSLAGAGGARMASAGEDGTIRIWDLDTPPRVAAVGGLWTGTLGDFVFEHGGAGVRVTDADGRIVAIELQGFGRTSAPVEAFHPLQLMDGRLQALDADHQLVEVELAGGGVVGRGLRPGLDARITTVRTTPGSTRAALGFRNGTIEVWDLGHATSMRLDSPQVSTAWEMAMDPKAAVLVSGHANGMLCRWDLGSGQLLQTLDADSVPVGEVVFGRDGRVVAVGRDDGRLTLHAPDDLAVIREVRAHSRPINAIEFSPDGSRLFTGGVDGHVIVWTLPELRALAVLPLEPGGGVSGRQDAIYRLRVSPDGAVLVAMTDGGQLRRWRLR